MGRRPKQTPLQRRHTDDQHEKMYVKRCSALLIIREMQIKTTMRYHLIPVWMAIIKSLQIINVGEGVEEEKSFYPVGGNVNRCSHCGEQYGCSSKN